MQTTLLSEHPVFAGESYRQAARRANHVRKMFGMYPHAPGGIRLTNAGQPVFVNSPQLLKLTEAKYYFVRGQRWTPSPDISINPFPFRTDHSAGDIVPLAGGIYIGERKLSDVELEKVGLIAVKDEKGQGITSPYFIAWGSRVLIDAYYRAVPIFGKTIDRGDTWVYMKPGPFPFIPRSADDLVPYVNAYASLTRQSILETIVKSQAVLSARWKESAGPEQIDFDTFKKRFASNALLDTILSKLVERRYANTFPSCGLQFKGAGGDYLGHLVYFDEHGSIPLSSRESILLNQNGKPRISYEHVGTFVGYPSLAGQFGIFLDQIHQPPPASPDPVGGMLQTDVGAIERDQLLLSKGAVMAGFSLSAIRLLEQEAIRNTLGLTSYQSGDLYILCRAAGTDTRRLSHLLLSPDFYRHYLLESYGDNFGEGRDKHLSTLAKNLGQNIRAVLACQLTAKPGIEINGEKLPPNVSNNLNPKGAIYDSTELVPAKDADEVGPLVFQWVLGLFEVGEASGGLSAADFIGNGRYLQALIEGFDGRKNKISETMLEILRSLPAPEAAAHITAFCVNHWKEMNSESRTSNVERGA